MSGTIRGCRRDVRGLVYLPSQRNEQESFASDTEAHIHPHRLLAVGLDCRLQILASRRIERGISRLALAHKMTPSLVGRSGVKAINKDWAYVAALPFRPASVAPTFPQPASFARVSLDDHSDAVRILCLLHHPEKLEAYLLAEGSSEVVSKKRSVQRHALFLRDGPIKLAEIHPRKSNEILFSTLSSCGQYVAYSDTVRSQLLKLQVIVSSRDFLI